MQKSCSKCGAEFDCRADDREVACWCAQLPVVELSPNSDCLCPECLADRVRTRGVGSESPPIDQRPLVEGDDYYMEGPSLVFTALYHLRRGYCCESGCRHCPYEN